MVLSAAKKNFFFFSTLGYYFSGEFFGMHKNKL